MTTPDRTFALGVAAVGALWFALGELQRFQNADSIMYVLMSLQRWTPFVWGQDRIGMLVPLLTLPLQHPMTNLVAQTALDVFAGLVASGLVLRYLLGPGRVWLAAAALQNAAVFLLTPPLVQFHWYVVHVHYGLSISLGMGALLSPRLSVALFGMLLAHWVNVAAGFVLAPLAVLRYVVDRDGRAFGRALAVIGTGTVVGRALMAASSAPATPNGVVPPWEWVTGWARMLGHAQLVVLPQPSIALWLVVPASLGLVWLLWRRSYRVLVVVVGLVWIGVSYGLTVGALTWVRANDYSPGYLVPSMVLVTTAAAALVAAPFERWGRAAALAAGALLLGSIALTSGWPSVGTVRRVLDERIGRHTPAVLAAGASVIAGDPWTVWPAVFHANLVAHGSGRRLYGQGERDIETRMLWPEAARVYVIGEDEASP